jgi:uncharacterized protein (DUF2141 family)
VYVDLNNNKLRDAGEPSAMTDAKGNYSLAVAADGLYFVRIDLSAAPVFSPTTAMPSAVYVAGGATVTVSTPIGVHRIDTVPPTVFNVQINDGSAQRSRVTSVTVKFSELVSFSGAPANAFTLTGPNGPVSLTVDTSGSTSIQTVAKLTFSGVNTDFTSLKDGRYTLRVSAAQVADLAGNHLDGNSDGRGNDDYVLASSGSAGVFRLFSDFNGDGTVATNDFIAFRQCYNSVNDMFDFDGDGFVSASDFIQFRQRFGVSI